MTDSNSIAAGIKEILEDILGVDEDELTPSAKFEGDLGGESIDILELSFRCEQRFGVRIQFEKMFTVEDIETDDRGTITPRTLAAIKTRLPFLDTNEFAKNPLLNRLMDLLTVDAITQFVQMRLAEETGDIG